jgi:hypothetical protein
MTSAGSLRDDDDSTIVGVVMRSGVYPIAHRL